MRCATTMMSSPPTRATGRARRLVALALVVALGGCALKEVPPHDEMAKQAAPNMIVPPAWAAGRDASGTPVADNWLAAWNDPALDALVNEALAYNTDLRAAAARVDLAAAYLKAAGAPIWPQVNLVARGGGPMGDGSGLSGVGLFASWELDIWGRVRAERAYSQMQYESARLDADYARQSVAALVAKGWVLAVESRLARERAEDMRNAAEQLASLTRDRLRVGVGDEYEVAVAQANVETYRDTVRNLDLAYQNALRALETLVGRYPAAAVTVAASLPRWPGDVPAGLPSTLLERRPDVVAAERRVASAFYRTEEAKAARLPRISLVANVTTLSSDMFVLKDRDNPVWSLGAGLVQPIFLGGYLQSQVEARTAEQQSAIADYGRVSNKVFGEVEGALSAGFASAEREAILQRAVRENQRALELANVRYRVGSGDLRGVQQQQLALYAVQVNLLRVQSERLVQRVNLHLALGGSFDGTPVAPTRTSDAGSTRP
jgi:NodT family efflux transporter outer membrane factor (OMF) lipoprotein